MGKCNFVDYGCDYLDGVNICCFDCKLKDNCDGKCYGHRKKQGKDCKNYEDE